MRVVHSAVHSAIEKRRGPFSRHQRMGGHHATNAGWVHQAETRTGSFIQWQDPGVAVQCEHGTIKG